jgi:VWFA-related protein
MNVDMVLVPITITDPMNRLVTGLEREDFEVFENNGKQVITTFASEDAPVSIGIIFDLSGSMTPKLIRARESILQFIKTANPQDEFFVIGFNDRPELIEDFTSSVEDIAPPCSTPSTTASSKCGTPATSGKRFLSFPTAATTDPATPRASSAHRSASPMWKCTPSASSIPTPPPPKSAPAPACSTI